MPTQFILYLLMQHDLEYVEKIEKELESRLFITAKEAANILGVSKRTITEYCKKGEIFAVRFAGKWLIYKESLVEFLLRKNNYEVF